MKKLTKRELIMLVLIIAILLSGFAVYGNKIVMDVGETIKVVCPYVSVSGAYEGNWQGTPYTYWDINCGKLGRK